MEIGIVIIGTNDYMVLAIRFIKNFLHFYKGKANIKFYLFCDDDPYQYLSKEECKHVMPFMNNHNKWREGTNAKFTNILKLENKLMNYVYYFDADTNINYPFTEDWFIGDMVGGQHFLDNEMREKEDYNFDYNIMSSCFIDLTLGLPKTYYYGAFFGGTKKNIMKFCTKLLGQMKYNQKFNHEPPWNDESYINAEFHYHPPTKVVKCQDFQFEISNKGLTRDYRFPSKKFDSKSRNLKQRWKRHMRRFKDKRWVFDYEHKTIKEVKD